MQAAAKPKRKAAPRRLVRDKPEDFVAGWFFPIAMPAYQAAIDVERTERRKTYKNDQGKKRVKIWYEWTQRAKPDWDFMEGDVFHTPLIEADLWSEQVKHLRWTVQIKRIIDKTVTIALTEYQEDRQSEHEISMDNLADLLRTGYLDGIFDFAGASPSKEIGHIE